MSEFNVTIDWLGGNCPIQAEGNIDGNKFYFRARGNRWSFEVGENPPSSNGYLFYYEEPYGEKPYEAGWMSESEARCFIEKAAILFHYEMQQKRNFENDRPS